MNPIYATHATKLVLTLWRKGREAPLPSACVTYQVGLDTPYRAFTVRVAYFIALIAPLGFTQLYMLRRPTWFVIDIR